jgi:hypothetical protein
MIKSSRPKEMAWKAELSIKREKRARRVCMELLEFSRLRSILCEAAKIAGGRVIRTVDSDADVESVGVIGI